MGIVEETIKRTLEKRDWDFYRSNYLDGKYSFSELVDINNQWHKLIEKKQVCFNLDWARTFFSSINEPVLVVELGCGTGEMAKRILPKFSDVRFWIGYDISSYAVLEAGDIERFCGLQLDKPFYKKELPPYLDAFVSAHTLEHMDSVEVDITLKKIIESNCRYVHLQLPVPEDGKIWKGGASSHVLRLGRKHIRNYFSNWKLIFDLSIGMNWGVAWLR